jgi:hypothetical protein
MQLLRVVSNVSNVYSTATIDILDYVSTAKNTTVRSLGGSTDRGGGTSTQGVELASGLFVNTAAVNQVTLLSNFANFTSGSRFSLYGIRG